MMSRARAARELSASSLTLARHCRYFFFLRWDILTHMLLEEREHLFRIAPKVVVAVPEAMGRILNPDHFLLLGSKQVEGFLRVFRILGPRVVPHLNREI